MNRFKLGDWVRCIDDSNSDGKLQFGCIYEVIDINEPFIKIKERGGEEWFIRRFELADDYILKEIWKD